MYKRRKKKIDYRQIIFLILIIIVLVLISIYIFNHKDRKVLLLEKYLKDAGAQTLKILNEPVNMVIENKSKKIDKKLKEKAESVDMVEAKYDEALKEIKNLKEVLELNSTLIENSYINATVISRNIGYFNNSLIIDKGSKMGVEKGMAVITNKGLIGTISSTSNLSSTVKLITSGDTKDKISVKIKVGDEYIYGLLVGYSEKKKHFIVEGISENTEIKKGSLVTTTGLGNLYPSGILIGKVVSTSKDNFDLARTLEVKSEENFDGFGYVTVINKEAIK